MKSKGTAYLLWLFSGFGVLGFHRFYLGKIGTGLLWMFTLGLGGFGALYDLFTLGRQVDVYNAVKAGRNANVNTNANSNVQNITVNVPPQAYYQQQPMQAQQPQMMNQTQQSAQTPAPQQPSGNA